MRVLWTRHATTLVALVVLGAARPSSAVDLTQVFTHPAGFSLRLPADWQANVSDEAVNFVVPGGEAESYFLLADPAAGLRQPDAPEVLSGLDEQVKQLAPYLQRRAGGQPLATGVGQGVVLVWEGQNPNGQLVQFKVYAAIAADHLVELTAVGPQAALAARQAVVDAVFGSLSTGGATAQPAASGGNPLGRPAAAPDPLVGRYAGDNLELELTGGPGQYAGTLTVGGQTYPLTAEARGATLYGTFTAGGTQYMFSAKLEGDTLSVTSDGATHQLARQGGAAANNGNPLGGAGGPAAGAGGAFSGTYAATVQGGGVNRLQLTQDGPKVTGTMALATGGSWRIEAQVAGDILQGFAADDQGALYFEAALAGQTLTMTFMEFDNQARQPKRDTGRAMPFQRESAAAPAAGGPSPAGGQPPPQTGGTAPLKGTPVQRGRVYNAGEQVVMEACGVGFTVPANLRAQLDEDGAGLVMADGQGRIVLVAGAQIVPDSPSPQQLLQEFVAQFAAPGLLGENTQLGLAAQPDIQGNTVVVQLQGQGPKGAISGHVIGVCSAAGGNEALVAAFGPQGDPVLAQIASSVAGSFAFGVPKSDITPWYQQLAGHTLSNNGGSYDRTSPNTTLNRDNQTTIQLAPDGRFTYQYRAMGMVTTPGGVGGQYDTTDTMQGRYRFFSGVAGPMLLLLPEGDHDPRTYSLSVDGNAVVMNGAPYSVN